MNAVMDALEERTTPQLFRIKSVIEKTHHVEQFQQFQLSSVEAQMVHGAQQLHGVALGG